MQSLCCPFPNVMILPQLAPEAERLCLKTERRFHKHSARYSKHGRDKHRSHVVYHYMSEDDIHIPCP